MKNISPFQVIDLRFRVDHNNPKKIQNFDDYSGATNNAKLHVMLFRHREFQMILVGIMITEVTIIWKDKTQVKRFHGNI